MIMDLGLNEESDLSKLDMGLSPYHWHSISKDHPNCLIPKITTQREELKKENEALKEKLQAPYLLQPLLQEAPPKHAPFKPPVKKPSIWSKRGRLLHISEF
jgi:hypothetical protein